MCPLAIEGSLNMIQNTTLLLSLLVLASILFVAVRADGACSYHSAQLKSNPDASPTPAKNTIPEAVHILLEKIADNLKDVLSRVLALLGNPTTLPANVNLEEEMKITAVFQLVGVLADVAKILGDVIEALGHILGFKG